MNTYFILIRATVKRYFDRISNEQFKQNLLRAIPFWLSSFITGVIAVLYSKIFGLAEKGAFYIFHSAHWLLFIVSPVCFFTAVWLVTRYAPYARGSGIPQVSAAIELSDQRKDHKINRLLSIRIIAVKIASSCVLALGGGITGREGPTIQIAGSVFRKVNQWLPEWWPRISKKNMIITGAAAGLAAAFNTPLGGIVFTIEELTKTHISFYKTAVFSAVIIAGLTAQAFLGPYLYLGYPSVSTTSFGIFGGVLLVALSAGIASGIMCKVILRLLQWKASLQKKWKLLVYILICSLVVATMAFLTDESAMNSGKDLMSRILFTSDKYLNWYTPIIRMLGSIVSFTSGAAGGVFAPALTAGAGIGSVFSGILSLSPVNTNLLILCGMVAFLTGVTRSPFTSAILVLEMTDGHTAIFYLMAAALASNLIGHFLDKKSFYDHLKDNYLRELDQQ